MCFIAFSVKKAYTLNNAARMQRDIFLHGPIETEFAVHSDFLSYKSGMRLNNLRQTNNLILMYSRVNHWFE